MELPADPGPRLDLYTPAPDSAEQAGLSLVASWNQTAASAR